MFKVLSNRNSFFSLESCAKFYAIQKTSSAENKKGHRNLKCFLISIWDARGNYVSVKLNVTTKKERTSWCGSIFSIRRIKSQLMSRTVNALENVFSRLSTHCGVALISHKNIILMSTAKDFDIIEDLWQRQVFFSTRKYLVCVSLGLHIVSLLTCSQFCLWRVKLVNGAAIMVYDKITAECFIYTMICRVPVCG